MKTVTSSQSSTAKSTNSTSSSITSSPYGESSTNSTASSIATQSAVSSTEIPEIRSTSYAEITQISTTTEVTSTQSNTYFSGSCIPSTPSNSMQLQVVLDATNLSVNTNGTAVNAVLSSGCNSDRETIYYYDIKAGPGGWFDFGGADAGFYNFSLAYQGDLYLFKALSHPAAVTCVTLSLPSGLVVTSSYEFATGRCPDP